MRLLLHVCCAPCSTVAIERMMKEHEVTLFFSNSNIWPQEEYERRLGEARKVASAYDLRLIEDTYDHAGWLRATEGLWEEPEKGKRCPVCFSYNMARAKEYAQKEGYDRFTTTLTISPHKDSKAIFGIGEQLGMFLAEDFKKKDGFRESCELSKRQGLYRQGYCGCEFSRNEREKCDSILAQGSNSMASPRE